ncbi:MAG: thioredoxin [Bacilli bacterium]|jgi:thioredoxin 1|nr:thioredoxin [Bacilli bacterium]
MVDLQKIFQENNKVLIDFYADWCGPCRMLAPVIEEVKKETAGTLHVVKVDVDANPQIAAQYGVRSIPTLAYIKDGKLVKQAVGFKSKKDILNMIQD